VEGLNTEKPRRVSGCTLKQAGSLGKWDDVFTSARLGEALPRILKHQAKKVYELRQER
jgi:hypothetical protein